MARTRARFIHLNTNVIVELRKREVGLRSLFTNEQIRQRKLYDPLYGINYVNLVNNLPIPDYISFNMEPYYKPIKNISFKHDGSLFLSNLQYRKLNIWDWSEQRFVTNIDTDFCHIHKILNFPSFSRIAYSSKTTVSLAEINEARVTTTDFYDHKNKCLNLVVHPSRPFVFISGSKAGVILRHDIRKPGIDIITDYKQLMTQSMQSIEGHPNNVHELCISSWFGPVSRFDERMPNQIIATYGNNYKRCIDNAIYNYDGSQILASNTAVALVYDINSSGERWRRRIHGFFLNYHFFGRNSNVIIGRRNNLHFWNVSTQNLYNVTDNMCFTSLAIHPVQPYICTGDKNGFIKIYSSEFSNMY